MDLRVAYLTAGTIGAGHLVRGLAIHRALERHGARGRFLLASPALDLTIDASLEVAPDSPLRLVPQTITVDSRRVTDPRHALESHAADLLRSFDPDLVLIDLFWVPFLHVVRACRAPSWLLLRSCPPKWLIGPPALPFDASAFARVIWTEPCAGGSIEGASRVEPIVIASREERPLGPTLREHLGLTDARPLSLIAHGGKPGEIEALDAIARARSEDTHAIARADLHTPGAPFPIAPWLGEADLIFGGAGYNLAWELTWLELHARSTLVPFARSIDDQAARAAIARTHRMRANGADQLAADILGIHH